MQLLPLTCFTKSAVLPGKTGTAVLSFPCVLWQAQVNHKIQQKPASAIHAITCAALVVSQWPKHSPYLQELQSSLVIFVKLDSLEGGNHTLARTAPVGIHLQYCRNTLASGTAAEPRRCTIRRQASPFSPFSHNLLSSSTSVCMAY